MSLANSPEASSIESGIAERNTTYSSSAATGGSLGSPLLLLLSELDEGSVSVGSASVPSVSVPVVVADSEMDVVGDVAEAPVEDASVSEPLAVDPTSSSPQPVPTSSTSSSTMPRRCMLASDYSPVQGTWTAVKST